MKPKVKPYTIVTFADDNIATSQTPDAGGAQSFTLNGDITAGGVLVVQELAYIIAFTCAANDSGRTLTITGTDADGAAQTEAVTGGNAGVVVSAKFFRSISGITTDADTAGAIEIGTVATTLVAQTPTYALDIYQPDTSVAVNVSGTINYTLLKCFERPTAGDSLNLVAGGLAAGTGDRNTAYTGPTGGIRLQINTYSNGATASMTIAQSRHT
jgi:hypothetical protein|tara:strand:+ start:5403 stop:6041 length:639 start_codon:yes stop_codon:yes gene_type:complete